MTRLRDQGLYETKYEHDACGIGAVVNITGTRDHSILEYGKQILVNLSHRGAAGSDETTGDGAGILFQIPHEFLAVECEQLGFALPFSVCRASISSWICSGSATTRSTAVATSTSFALSCCRMLALAIEFWTSIRLTRLWPGRARRGKGKTL